MEQDVTPPTSAPRLPRHVLLRLEDAIAPSSSAVDGRDKGQMKSVIGSSVYFMILAWES